MAFVRKRGNSHQLIETYRDGDSVKQRIIANLGPHDTLAKAYAADPERYRRLVEPDDAEAEVVSSPVVSSPKGDRLAEQRRAVLALVAELRELASAIGSSKNRAAIAAAFEYDDGADDCPAGVTLAEIAKTARSVMAWLPGFVDEIAPRRGKRRSKASRWQGHVDDAVAALEDIKELQSEFQDWRDRIPEALQEGATVDKLDEITGVDVDTVIAAIEELREVEFPRGYGQD